MSNDNKFYCSHLDRWFDSLYEMQQAVFGNMQWPSAEEERDMIRAANISVSRKGKPCSKHKSEEARAKSSAAQKGKPKSPETRVKMRDAKIGKPLTEEHKANIGAASKGKKWSSEAIVKRTETRRRNREAKLAALELTPTE